MSGEADAFPALTPLRAACEQALLALDELSPPAPETTQLAERLQARLYELFKSGRFANRRAAQESFR
jgi:hypothetical protein